MSDDKKYILNVICKRLIDYYGIKDFLLMLNAQTTLPGNPDNPERSAIVMSTDNYGFDFLEEAEGEMKSEYGTDFPFLGVSFEQGEQYVILSFDEAEKEILKVIDKLGFSDRLERDCIFPRNGDAPLNSPV